MEHPVAVTVHPSVFPERTRAAYLESFRARRMNHRFHYETEKQAQQWLALHEAYSPARTDDDCLRTYNTAVREIANTITSDSVSLISIGCGGGQKDITFLNHLSAENITYVPTDVSLPLTLTAHHYAARNALERGVHTGSPISKPALLDLPAAIDLPAFLNTLVPLNSLRIIAFFGMLPNFEPNESVPILSSALRPDDLLILSANLAPGADYHRGVEKILPLYDNDLTRHWLSTVLIDAGLDISPADIDFSIQSVSNLLRVEANYCFKKRQSIRIDNETFEYSPGEVFRLFFSYRHTPTLLSSLLKPFGIEILRQWNTTSQEEGVFLCRKVSQS